VNQPVEAGISLRSDVFLLRISVNIRSGFAESHERWGGESGNAQALGSWQICDL
jgi:hypothetical protein